MVFDAITGTGCFPIMGGNYQRGMMLQTIIYKELKMNRKQKVTINKKNDCLTTPFKLTTVSSYSGPINRTVSLVDGSLEYSADCESFEGNLEVVECEGLSHLQQMHEKCYEDFAIALGFPQQDGESIQSVDIIWKNPSTNSSNRKATKSLESLMQFIRNEVSLIVFDVPGSYATPEAAWGCLCSVDPQLNFVGYVVTHSPYSYIRNVVTGEMLTVANGLRFYCLTKKSGGIRKYGEKFAKWSWIRGYGHVELSNSGDYLIRQIVNAEDFHPGHTVCETAILGQGLTQERPRSELHAGRLLDTRKLRNLDDIEESVYLLKVKEAMASIKHLHDLVKDQWLERRSYEIAETTGCSKHVAWQAAQSVSDNYTLPDVYTLKFEQHGWVTVAEVLADPMKFDKKSLTDPKACHDERYVAVFEWKNGNPFIRSAVNGGCNYGFTAIEVLMANCQLLIETVGN